MRKFLLLALICVVALASTAGAATNADTNEFYEDFDAFVADGQPEIFTNAEEMAYDYDANPGIAALKYTEKECQICGVISAIDTKEGSISLVTNNQKYTEVFCKLDDDHVTDTGFVKVGEAVTIQGTIGYPIIKRRLLIFNCWVVY